MSSERSSASMTPSRWQHIKDIVANAAETNSVDRNAYLDDACRDDPELRREVESLLYQEDDGAVLLDIPDANRLADSLHDHRAEAVIGQTIGGFKIRSVLGYGGMGVVYRAEQEHPQREVALKIISGGAHATPSYVRLFRREIQSLGRLQHQGIAAVHDAGTTEQGYHYFAMELVNGCSLSEFVRQSRASETTLLELFVQICRTIHYAHQKGVIHRDIKPSNILIREDGQPKILDFGLAKLTGDAGEVSGSLSVGRIHGTLSYMSPEQARGESNEIDTRSDVYSLGIVLFELLTGERPYLVTNVSVPKAIETICQAPLPEVKRLAPTLASDLEIIMAKALEKDPVRRYQSADALADDIERFLAREPIAARKPSAIYHIGRFVHRHRGLSAATIVLIVICISFGAAMTVLYERANREARTSTAITRVLLESIQSANLNLTDSPNYTVRELLHDISDQMSTELESDPVVESHVHNILANAFDSLGEFEKASVHMSKSVSIRDLHDLDSMIDFANRYFHLGWRYHNTHDFEKSESMFRTALKHLRNCRDAPQSRIAETMSGLADVLGHVEEYEEAEKLARDAISIFEELGTPNTAGVRQAAITLADLLRRQNRLTDAEAVLLESIPRAAQLSDSHPQKLLFQRELGRVRLLQKNYKSALAVLVPLEGIETETFPSGHYWIAATKNLMAQCELGLGNQGIAEKLLESSAQGVDQTTAAGAKHAREAVSLLVDLLERSGETERAVHWRAMIPGEHPSDHP